MSLGAVGVVLSVCAAVYVWRSLRSSPAAAKASDQAVACVLLHPMHPAARARGEQRLAVRLPPEDTVKGMAKAVARRTEECRDEWRQLCKDFPEFSFADLIERHRKKLVKKLLAELEVSIDPFMEGKWSVAVLCPELSLEELNDPVALDKLVASVTAKKPLHDLAEFFLLRATPEKEIIEREDAAKKLHEQTERFLFHLRQLCVVSFVLQLIKRCHDDVEDWRSWLNWQMVASTVLPALVTVGLFYYQSMSS